MKSKPVTVRLGIDYIESIDLLCTHLAMTRRQFIEHVVDMIAIHMAADDDINLQTTTTTEDNER